MIIALILQGIALCVLGIVVGSQVKDISSLKKRVHEMTYNRNLLNRNQNHISRIEQGNIERLGRNNRDLIEKLAKEMDKKVEPVYSKYYTGHPSFYVLVDLTEKEKRANELRREIEKLEESDD